MRKGNRWRKHREWPSVREMAEPTGLLPLYDFLYAATSSFVHYSPNNLIRMGKVVSGSRSDVFFDVALFGILQGVQPLLRIVFVHYAVHDVCRDAWLHGAASPACGKAYEAAR